ncbi:hypothetical protein Hanom_Chr09g00760601 [Helianthus anomalus]
MCGCSGGKSESALILTLFYKFLENNVKRRGWLIMHHVVALIAERQKGTCTNWHLSSLLSVMCLVSKALCKTTIKSGVSLEAVSLFLRGRGKAVYILPSSGPTLALLLMGYDDDEDDDDDDCNPRQN